MRDINLEGRQGDGWVQTGKSEGEGIIKGRREGENMMEGQGKREKELEIRYW